jgi:hypothetical protein
MRTCCSSSEERQEDEDEDEDEDEELLLNCASVRGGR